MAAEPIVCPYCNAYVTIPADATPGQRVSCPRCGEAFAYRPQEENGSGAGSIALAGVPGAPVTDLRTIPRRWSNRVVAAAVLGLMAVMTIIGLFWALKTVPDRRGRDRQEPAGYLPADVDVVAMVQVTKSMETPAGRDFLRTFGLGPGAGGGMINLKQWTGLNAEDIDQVVLGLKVKDHTMLPRLTLVVETRQAYDVETIRKELDAKSPIERQGRTLHPFSIGAVPAEMWCPTQTILVIGLEPNDLDAVPATPQLGIDHLSSTIQGLLRDQMGQGCHALLAADSDEWEKRVPPLWLLMFKPILAKHDGQVWSSVGALGVWLRFDEAIHLKGAFRMVDVPAAEEMKAYLLKKDLAGDDEVEIRKDVWVTIETQTTGERVRDRLKDGSRMLPMIRRE